MCKDKDLIRAKVSLDIVVVDVFDLRIALESIKSKSIICIFIQQKSQQTVFRLPAFSILTKKYVQTGIISILS